MDVLHTGSVLKKRAAFRSLFRRLSPLVVAVCATPGTLVVGERYGMNAVSAEKFSCPRTSWGFSSLLW